MIERGFRVAPLLACALLAGGIKAQAADKTDPVTKVQMAIADASRSLASGAKVAVFPYRANKIYEVGIKPGMFTTFTFPRGEKIKQFALSAPDAAEVAVNEETNSAMLRLETGITMSATIVTSKRTYYLTINPSTGQWHQGVSWSYGDADGEGTVSGFGYRAPAGAAGADEGASPEDSLAGQPNFNYTVEGDAAVAPVAVWDNGRFTWLQFSDSVQSIPAVFFLGPDGPEVVNYIVQPGGKQVKVNRLMRKIMLRLGSQKAIVTAK